MMGREYDAEDLLEMYDVQATQNTSSQIEPDDINDTSEQYAESNTVSQSTYEHLNGDDVFKSSQYLSMLDNVRLTVSSSCVP